MRKTAGLAVLIALTLGCGSADGGTTTGLRGRALVPRPGPCRVNEPCSRPSPGIRLLFYRSGKSVAKVTTNRRGWYRVQLTPGVYDVRSPQAKVRKPSPSRVTVPKDGVKRVDFHIDTGIR